jgi:class 3 adenylate cyclase
MALPEALFNYLSQLIEHERTLAYLKVDQNGCIVLLGGNWEAYGVKHLQIGDVAEEKLFFLCGLLPLGEEKFLLPKVKIESGLSADVHIFTSGDEYWIILLSVVEEELKQQLMQQKINDLSLLRDKQARMLGMMLGSEAEQLSQEIKLFNNTEHLREVAILFTDLRGFTSYSEKTSPEETFKVLNQYLRVIIAAVVDEAGILDKIIGDGVMAIFGVLPSTGVPQKQALRATLRAINALDELNSIRKNNNLPCFELGVGIASGTIALGLLNGKEQKFLGALGQAVRLAAKLENQARDREILIDNVTFEKLDEMQIQFSPQPAFFNAQPITAFSWIVNQNHEA